MSLIQRTLFPSVNEREGGIVRAVAFVVPPSLGLVQSDLISDCCEYQDLQSAKSHFKCLYSLRSDCKSDRAGIFCTEVIRTKAPADEVVQAYKDFYADSAFTHYSDKPLDLKQVVNTYKCLVHIDAFDNKLLVTSCIDNLLKGAVGQAVQNMNLMFGIDETAGLSLKASAI